MFQHKTLLVASVYLSILCFKRTLSEDSHLTFEEELCPLIFSNMNQNAEDIAWIKYSIIPGSTTRHKVCSIYMGFCSELTISNKKEQGYTFQNIYLDISMMTCT